MRKKGMDKLDKLIQKYVEAVMIHGKESWGGDYKKANRYYKVYTKCFIDICKYGEEGKNVLKELLNHNSHFVRYSAAYHMLPFDSVIAVKMLKKCKGEPEGVGFNAKTTMDEWNSSNLKFPIEKEGKILYVTANEFIRECIDTK